MPHVYNHNDGITNMAETLLQKINVTNPQFLKEYEGWYIGSPEGMYQVKNGQVNLVGNDYAKQLAEQNFQGYIEPIIASKLATPFDIDRYGNKVPRTDQYGRVVPGEYPNREALLASDWYKTFIANEKPVWVQRESGKINQDLQAKMVSFDPKSGLQPAGKGSYQNTEAWRYSSDTPTAENNWLGQGRPAPTADQYTGQTGGYTSGGVLLYKLKDGTVTSTPPSGQTAPAPISQEEMRALGPEVTTGGVVTPEAQAETNQPTTPTTSTAPTNLPSFKKGDITITPTSIDAQGNYITPMGTFSEADLMNQGFTKAGVAGETPPISAPARTPASTAPAVPTNLNTTPLGLSGVNALFTQYYGRNATQEELNYWSNKSDAELRPKLIPNSEVELARNKSTVAPVAPATPTDLNTTPLGDSGVNALFTQYYGRDATQEELNYWSAKSDAELRPKLIPNSAIELAKNKPGVEQPGVEQPVGTGLNTTPLGDSGVNALFMQYYGRDASMEELEYWKNKSDAELRPKLIPNSERELIRNKPTEKSVEKPVVPGEKQIGEDYVNYLYNLYLGRDANDQEKLIYKNHADDSVIRRDLEFAKKKATDEQAKTDEAAKLAEEQKAADDAKKAEEEAAKQNSLQTIYGQTKQPAEVEELVGNFIGAAATSFLRKGGISQATFDKYIKNDPTQLAKYVNMMLYGGYDKAEYLYRDLKAKELADQGNTAYQNYKVFDETVPASQWFNTPEGQKALNDTMLTPPAGVINETLLNNTIFTIPNEAFSTLFEPIDINSPAFKAEAEKIQASYYDIMTQKAQAETEQQKAVADENYKMFTADLNKKYGIQLSDNAQAAWGQLQNLFSGATQRGLGQSGLISEAMDKYLADQRDRDQILRDEKTTTQEKQELNNLLKSGSSAEIQAFVAANPDKAKQLGLVPSAEVANWYSTANLKTLYPTMTDTEINNIRNSMIDENGNYRSDLYQTLEANRYGFGQDKQTYQQQKLYEQKLTEAEKAYRPYTRGNLFSSYTGVKPTPAAPTTPPVSSATEPKVSVKDKNGNTILVYPSSIPALIAEGTLPAGTTPTSVSSSVPTPTPPASAPAPTPIPSTNNKVQVKDKNGNLITVYEDSIPDLIKEGTLPAGTTASTKKAQSITTGKYGEQTKQPGVSFVDTPPVNSQLRYTAVMPPSGMKYVYNQTTGERSTVPITSDRDSKYGDQTTKQSGETFDSWIQRTNPSIWTEARQQYVKSQEWENNYQRLRDIFNGVTPTTSGIDSKYGGYQQRKPGVTPNLPGFISINPQLPNQNIEDPAAKAKREQLARELGERKRQGELNNLNPFTEWTKGKTDMLGKNWRGYKPIEGASYNIMTPEERKKKYGNVQAVGNTLYGYKY